MGEIAKIGKVTGPPGTGKTTYLLGLIEAAVDRYSPSAVGAISYTKAAVETIRDRVEARGVDREMMRNARTLHSLCFSLLGMTKQEVAEGQMKLWNEKHPDFALPIDHYTVQDDDGEEDLASERTQAENSKIFSRLQIYRCKGIPQDRWKDPEAEMFWEKWRDWMMEEGLTDYTGMLEKVLIRQVHPGIDILFVDECQDASPLQLAILKMWSERTVSTLFVGDSDQAIFRFAGAVPEEFISLQHNWNKVLEQSYRVPRAVHEYAMRVIGRAVNREQVAYRPTAVEGNVYYNAMLPDLSMDGTHMILARCRYQVEFWRKHLMERKIPWANPYRPGDKSWNPASAKGWKAAQTYVRLRRGDTVGEKALRGMIGEMVVKGNLATGVKAKAGRIALPGIADVATLKQWQEPLFTDEFLAMNKPITEVLKLTGQAQKLIPGMAVKDLLGDPRIFIGTIHSVKGGEADHVWIDTGTSPTIFRECMESERAFWDEIRVAYVAATRARQSLGLLLPHGKPNPAFHVA